MKPFCEVIVTEILPTIRMLITNHLLQNYDYTQTKIARILGITQAAVSQYSTAARGKRLKLIEKNKKIMGLIEKLANDIAKGKIKNKEVHIKFCELCEEIRKSRLICKLHEDSYPTLAPCDYCFR